MTQRRTRIVAASGTLALVGALAMPAAAGPTTCRGLTNTTSRCPVAAQAAADLPTYVSVSVADVKHHRVYALGPDEGGWMSFVGMDTRTGKIVVRSTSRLTQSLPSSGYAVNPMNAVITPDGRRVLTAGYIYGGSFTLPAVVAFDTRTGRVVWKRFGRNRGAYDSAMWIALDPAGRHAFVALDLYEKHDTFNVDWIVESLNVRTGNIRWRTPLGVNDKIDQWPLGITYVAGRVVAVGAVGAKHPGGRADYDGLAVVYAPATGKKTAKVSYDGGVSDDYVYTVTPSPATGMAIVMGNGELPSASGTINRAVVLGLDPKAGRWRWMAHPQTPGGDNYAYWAAASGQRVFVDVENKTPASLGDGQGLPVPGTYAYASASSGSFPSVVAYNAATGHQAWQADLQPSNHGTSYISAMVPSVDGRRVYVVGANSLAGGAALVEAAGRSAYHPQPHDALVVALQASSGHIAWSSLYNDDPTTHKYDDEYESAAATDRGLVATGFLDERTVAENGTIDGTIVRFAR